MTWPEAQRKIMWHQRRVMETPMNSRERMESIKILREAEAAAYRFFGREKAAVGAATAFNPR